MGYFGVEWTIVLGHLALQVFSPSGSKREAAALCGTQQRAPYVDYFPFSRPFVKGSTL